MNARRFLCGAALTLAAVGSGAADTLRLAGGGSLRIDHWWYEGDEIRYETAVGTVGIPRTLVIGVDGPEAEVAPPPAPEVRAAPVESAPPRPRTVEVPARLGGLLNEARDALDAGDYRVAADLYEDALEQSDASLHLPRVGYVLSHMALGNDDMALQVVLSGLAYDPQHSALLELLGDLNNRRELVRDALQAWRQAFLVDPNDRLRAKIEKAERELSAADSYSFQTSANFNMRFDGEVDRALAEDVTDHLERSYWELASIFLHSPPQPITVLLYPRREFRDVTLTPEWVGGVYDGKIRVPLGGLDRLNPDARAVLVHELTHAVIHSKTRGRAPRWLHEGLAQQAEGRRLSRAGRRHVLERLDGVDPARWEDAGFSYPIALSLVGYVDERYGFTSVLSLLDRLADGGSVDDALGEALGESYESLCRSWARWFLARESAE